MKATGIVRRVDDLGRIIIPKEIRRTLGMMDGEPLEIFTDGDMVIFKKYKPSIEVWASNIFDEVPDSQVEFNIFDDRTTICRIDKGNNQPLYGIATRRGSDIFSEEIGMAIAYCRAAGISVPKEFYKEEE